MKVYTYISPEVRDLLVRSMESLVTACPYLRDSELVILHYSSEPGKVLSKLSSLFKKVTITKIDLGNDRNIYDSSVGMFASYCLSKIDDFDGLYIDPTVFVVKSVDFRNFGNYFVRNDRLIISPKIFVIRSIETFRKAIVSYMVVNRIPWADCNLITYVINTNFLIRLTYNTNEPMINAVDYPNSKFDEIMKISPIYVDMSRALGSNYRMIHSFVNREELRDKRTVIELIKKFKRPITSASSIEYDSFNSSNFGDLERDLNRVSIIMTNHNCEGYLDRAIRSVLQQTYSNLELIIVDDASTDESLRIIEQFANVDSRIRVFRNLVQRGTYWSKNSVIHKTTGSYITMLDSDDYDFPNRLEKQISGFTSNSIVCVTCLNDRKISEFSKETERISTGYASMMFRYEVFATLGHYDTVKFGADSEFYDRLKLVYGRTSIVHIDSVLQISPRRTLGLTGIIPESSFPRQEYLKSYVNWHRRIPSFYMEFPQLIRPFPVLDVSIVEYSDLSNSAVIKSKSTQILPVIMCVWKRVEGFSKVVELLNNQTFKNFKLFVWNNNKELASDFIEVLKSANFDYEFYTNDENIGGFGRFEYARKIRRNPGLLDHCVFIDDDQTFNNNLLDTFINEAKPNTILSQWGWKFKKLSYYGEDSRVSRKPGETIHYAGTGGMVVDMRVFDSEGLFECPTKYKFIEDLWLSFYANHKLGFNLLKSAAVMKNGDDQYSLYREVKDIKTPMLIDLIENYGWQIL
jgi:glycosyltransferase involved in cell wall biosynthesis